MSHVGLYVHDLQKMEDFYARVLGFTVTDRGKVRGADIVFTSWDPKDHHQVALVIGRPKELAFNHRCYLAFCTAPTSLGCDRTWGELRRQLPDATWTAAGIGRYQSEVMEWALRRDADAIRTGLEDNMRLKRGQLAKSNAELASLAVEKLSGYDARPARSDEARTILGLAVH
jgi:catechol 2,3-dioxygenase-like lactoylglutathione lyase family enzyme